MNGSGALLHVFNVHLGTALGERRHQGRKLMAPELLADVGLQHPRIVLGDFNEWTSGLATRLLRGPHEERRFPLRAAIPACCLCLHLDHIYYDEDLVWRS